MTFANFIFIHYRLLIDRMPSIESLTGGNIIGFAMTFIAIYVPLSIIIGYWHRKSQWRVEAEALFNENRIGGTMCLFVIDLIDGKITEQEKKEMREMLLKITKGNKIPKSEKFDKDNKEVNK